MMVAFADDEYEPINSLLIQKSYLCANEETEFNKIYLEIEDQNRSCFGNISSMKVEDHIIYLILDKKTSGSLQVNEKNCIKINKTHPDFDVVIGLLRRIIGESEQK